MKTAAKMFIWLGMVFGFYLIVPLVIGIVSLQKIEKNEASPFGVVTMLFCSFLGGLFMLLINEENSAKINPHIKQTEKTVLSEEELRTLNGRKKETRFCMWFTLISAAVNLVLGLSTLALLSDKYWIRIEGAYYAWGYYLYEAEVALCIAAVVIQAIFLAIPFAAYIYNKQWVSPKCCIALICAILPSVAAFACTLSAVILNFHALFLFVFLISFLLLILNIVLPILNRKVLRQTKKTVVTVNVMELKLKEIESMLERNVINQAEYEEMRKNVISKFS